MRLRIYKTLLLTFFMFYLLPLAIGTSVLRGYVLHFTLYDAGAMFAMILYFASDLVLEWHPQTSH